MIDENFGMKVKIHDDLMDASQIQRFKYTRHCIVSKFLREYTDPEGEPMQLFRDPSFVPDLTVRSPISRQNFLLIADECHKVKNLICTGAWFANESNIFDAAKLERFTNGLEKLLLTGVWIDPADPENPAAKNLIGLLNCSMPNLTSLTIRANYPVTFDENHFVSFIEKCRALKSLELTMNYSEKTATSKLNPTASIAEVSEYTILTPTLTRIKIDCRYIEFLQAWLLLLKTQRSVKDFSLFVRKFIGFDHVQQLQGVLLQNQLSLEYLELGEIWHSAGRVEDLKYLFRNMVNLKCLKLKLRPEISVEYLKNGNWN